MVRLPEGWLYEPSDGEIEMYKAAIQVLIDQFPTELLPEEWCDTPDGVIEYAYDLGLTGGEFYTRVFDSIKVEKVPVEITLEDVTEEFMK